MCFWKRLAIASLACVAALFASPSLQAAEPFELRDGDRVVLLGDGLIEQEQYFGWVEWMLTTAFPDAKVTFRNLGWNADTPAGASRLGLSLVQAGKEPEGEGWRQLQTQLELTQPTVLIVGYGMASALESVSLSPEAATKDPVKQFEQQLQQLVESARNISPDIRFVFLTPLQPLDLNYPNSRRQMVDTQAYAQVVLRIAKETKAAVVSLEQCALDDQLRTDAIHLNEKGYQQLAQTMASQLGIKENSWTDSPPAESLRQLILQKNQWWFHRSRPANMAYVFGFRQHEQGQNAAEIPKFDELIEGVETAIAGLRTLDASAIALQRPRVESQYAKFTEQPRPEFAIAEGWDVTLWAENPQLNKPIHMNFDPQGRLWIASSEAYPMIEVGQAAPDKILVLQDTNGDGKADRSDVFADGLLIPTGLAPGNGGVYVAQSTDLLFLKDTDGDGRADVKERVLSGFGTEDTHHNLHTLTWGPDSRLYMNQSVYTRTDTETPHGVVRLRAGGGFRFDPRTLRMEVMFRGLWNSWGHQFDEFGQSFLTDGAGFDGLAYTFPGAIFNPTPKAIRQLELISPGKYPKFCGLEFIQGKTYPPEWQGSLVTCDFRANRVTRFSLTEQGAGFATKQEADLLRTSASTFRPIDIKQGPDGALYIADWSNPIINHGEVDFRDPRRDRWHGRIWRVSWNGGKNFAKPQIDLAKLATTELLNRLTSDDHAERDLARRILVERPDATRDAIGQWTQAQPAAHHRLQALWLSQGLDVLDTGLLDELLATDDPRIRAAAVRVLGCWSDPLAVNFDPIGETEAVELLQKCVRDSHPRVRLEAVCALTKIASEAAAFTALEVLQHPMDRFLEFALAEMTTKLSSTLMDAVQSGRWQADSPTRQAELEFILMNIEPSAASQFLSDRLSQHPIASDGAGPWIELIGSAGGPAELQLLLSSLLEGKFDEATEQRAFRALGEAFRLRKKRPNKLDQLGRLLQSPRQATRNAAAELAGSWKIGSLVQPLAALARDKNNALNLRRTSVKALSAIGNPAAVEQLTKLVNDFSLDADAASTPNNSAEQAATRRQLFREATLELLQVDAQPALKPFVRLLIETQVDTNESENSETKALQLWRSGLASKGFGKLLAKEIADVELPQSVIQAGLRAAQDSGRDEPELLSTLKRLGDVATSVAMTPERMKQLAEQAIAHGDPARGELIYRRTELACVTCHAIGGVGGRVGPDMSSLGASAPVDYIVESLFEPNAKIKEGFHSVTVATEDGLVINGIEIESTDTELVLRDVANKLIRIATSDIAGKKPGLSLMPVGVVDRLQEAEQVDLIAFLSKLGKPGEFDASNQGSARILEILPGTHRLEQSGSQRIYNGELSEGWKSIESRVSGNFDSDKIRELTRQPIHIALVHVYARTRVQVPKSGTVTLTIDSQKPLAMWIDGEQVAQEAKAEGTQFATKLTSGEHLVVIRFDARDLPEQFKLRSPDVTFATEFPTAN